MTTEEIKKNLQELASNIAEDKKYFSCFKRAAYSYMIGSTKFPHKITPIPCKPSAYYSVPAGGLYEQWRDETRENLIYGGREPIPHPGDLSLIDYLNHLSTSIYNNERRLNWKKSLFSFLRYLREDMVHSDDKKFIETIFPLKKKLQPDYILEKKNEEFIKKPITHILRKTELEDRPIDIVLYADIIKGLVNMCLYSRANALHGAAEALGFVWLCFISASHRLMSPLKGLHDLNSSALGNSEENKHVISLETLAGAKELPISEAIHTHFKLLRSLHQKPTIFSMSLPSLRRPFNTAVKKSSHAVGARKITFRTMLAMPHEAIGH